MNRKIQHLLSFGCSLAFLSFAPQAVAQNPNPIRVNQVGYYPQAQKVATVEAAAMGKTYVLRDATTKKCVWKGKMTEKTTSPWSGKKRGIVDFSAVTQPGNYILSCGKWEQPVLIREAALTDVAVSTMKAFYLQRTAEDILPEYAGKYARPAAHPDTKVLVHPSAALELDGSLAANSRPAGTVIASPGGWYDAGDFNKYIVNSGFSVGLMLCAYEENKDYFNHLPLNIPKSQVGLPDYLEEIAFNIHWMQTMQDPSGGVYHKLTTPNFEGFIMPKDCQQPRYVVMKTTAAALDFAATLAKASRIYRQFEGTKAWAEELLSQACMAYAWALEHPAVYYEQNKMNDAFDPDITTGAYDDMNVQDEFLWAKIELSLSLKAFGRNAQFNSLGLGGETEQQKAFGLPSWGNVAGLALYTLIDAQAAENCSATEALVEYAADVVADMAHSPFASAYGYTATDFGWGCNAEGGAGKGIALLYAYRLTGQKEYLEAALSAADYLLGRNATGYCYVTGFGNFSPQHPHQRLSAADGIDEPLPGFLVGGPNPEQQDKEYCKTYTSAYPDESYADDTNSFASNEIAINWNASAAAFFGWLDAEMQKK